MPTVYAATWVEKLVSDWSPTEGASTSSRCLMNNRINVQADSLPGLLKAIGKKYFLAMDDLFIPAEEDEGIEVIGYNQVETVDCMEPTEDETAEWEAGKLDLYLCDYSFGVEKRIVSALSLDDFKIANIKTH